MLISWGWWDEISSEFCRLEPEFINSKWGPCFMLAVHPPWMYVWWHDQRMHLKRRCDCEIPLEELFPCLAWLMYIGFALIRIFEMNLDE